MRYTRNKSLGLFLTLSIQLRSTWISESFASRKKKRLRKSVIYADANRHGVPRRSSRGVIWGFEKERE